MSEVLLPEIAQRRRHLFEHLGLVDQEAVLIMDQCSCHTNRDVLDTLEQHHVRVVLLVPHSSHATQPLDLGVFGTCKNFIRSRSKYLTALRRMEEEDSEDDRVPPAEQGAATAAFMLDILRAFHDATYDTLVVSAFEQAGILKRREGANVLHEVAYTDPTCARVVVREMGLFADAQPVPRPAHRRIKISELNRQFSRRAGQLEIQRRPAAPMAPLRAPPFPTAPTAPFPTAHPAARPSMSAHMSLFLSLPPPRLALSLGPPALLPRVPVGAAPRQPPRVPPGATHGAQFPSFDAPSFPLA